MLFPRVTLQNTKARWQKKTTKMLFYVQDRTIALWTHSSVAVGTCWASNSQGMGESQVTAPLPEELLVMDDCWGRSMYCYRLCTPWWVHQPPVDSWTSMVIQRALVKLGGSKQTKRMCKYKGICGKLGEEVSTGLGRIRKTQENQKTLYTLWIVNKYILLIKKVTTTICIPQINIRKLKVNKVEKYSLHNKKEVKLFTSLCKKQVF